jgi:hypothetical protein
MRVFLVSNEGGYSDWIDNIEKGVTVSELISKHCPQSAPNDLMIRVNSKGVDPGYLLNDGDYVTATPKKVDGGN